MLEQALCHNYHSIWDAWLQKNYNVKQCRYSEICHVYVCVNAHSTGATRVWSQWGHSTDRKARSRLACYTERVSTYFNVVRRGREGERLRNRVRKVHQLASQRFVHFALCALIATKWERDLELCGMQQIMVCRKNQCTGLNFVSYKSLSFR